MKLQMKISRRKYMCFALLLTVVMGIQYFDHSMDEMNTTVFAFSYKYGLLSRGFLGSFLQWWDSISSVDLLSYHTVYQISEAATLLFFLSLLLFIGVVLKHCTDRQVPAAEYLFLLLLVIAVPTFSGVDNFGRLDVYLMIIMLVCVTLMVWGHLEWLIIPLCIMASLIHEGFVFTHLNLILALLLYKAVTSDTRKRKIKYWIILICSLTGPSVLFLYFEFFSHKFGMEVYREIYALAAQLSVDGRQVHRQVLQHEILGKDVSGMERAHHRWNREDMIAFVLLFMPYLIILVKFLKHFLPGARGFWNRLSRLVLAAGPLTLLPEWILKVDYGRYIFGTMFYYLALIPALLALQDKQTDEVVSKYAQKDRTRPLLLVALAVYLLAFMPFGSYRISKVITSLTLAVWGN